MRLEILEFMFQAVSFACSCFVVGAITGLIRARTKDQKELMGIFRTQRHLNQLQAERTALLEAAVYGHGDGAHPAPGRVHCALK